MENTLENKAKFFAQYWGQEVLCSDTFHYKNKKMNGNNIPSDHYLELKPLLSITDEDAYLLAKLYWRSWIEPIYTDDPPAHWNEMIDGFEFHGYFGVYSTFSWKINSDSNVRVTMMIEEDCRISIVKGGEIGSLEALTMYDYLRSKGYALPFMGLSVEKQIEYGWIKLK